MQCAQRHAQLYSPCGVLAGRTSPAPKLGVTDDPPGGRTPAGWARWSEGTGAATQPQTRGLRTEGPRNPVLTHRGNQPADVQTVRAGPGRPRAVSRCCERLSPCLRGQDSQRRGKASPGHASPRTVRPDSSGPTPHLTTLRFKRLRWFVTLSEVFEALGCSILNGRTSKAASPTRPFFGRCHKGPARGVMHTKSPDRQAAEPRVESGHHTACLAA